MWSAKPKPCRYEIVKPWALSRHLFAAPLLLSEAICCGANTQSSKLTDVCPAITPDKMFLFWPLYILLVQAWSWLCRKVNAAAGAAEHGEKWFSTQTQPALRPHSNHTLWNSEGKPKQQAGFIFNTEFMVMPALLKSMFSLGKLWFETLWLLFLCTWERSTGPTWSLLFCLLETVACFYSRITDKIRLETWLMIMAFDLITYSLLTHVTYKTCFQSHLPSQTHTP